MDETPKSELLRAVEALEGIQEALLDISARLDVFKDIFAECTFTYSQYSGGPTYRGIRISNVE